MASNNSSLQEPNLGDDPKATIQEILKIMDRLRTKLLPSHTLTTSRSFDAEINKRKENLQLVPIARAVSTGQEGSSPNVFLKLQLNLRLLKESVSKVQQLHQDVGDEVRKHLAPLEKLLELVNASETQLTKAMEKNLEDINKKIFNMMFQVPLLPNNLRKPKGSHSQDEYYDRKHFNWFSDELSNEERQERHTVLRQVRDKFEMLSSTHLQNCLLSFAVFPENEEVHRTMVMYWWILPDQVKPEDAVKDILKELTEERLIEPVENKRKLEPVSYKMPHFVHLSVVCISKEMGLFDVDDEEEEDPTIRKSTLDKVCLIEGSSSLPGATKMAADSIETVFNVSEMFPEFALKWFSKEQPSQKKKTWGRLLKTSYKSLKVFYLGRWERTPNRHIEVGSPKLMKYLKHMTKLRLLSFQGISKIETLNSAICKLPELIVLDLRACYNLEKLPDKISSLKNLTYLDMSGCYMIDRMPKTLSWLDNLEVLKGFVVSDATDEEKVCTLTELNSLSKLRKLSITICNSSFGVFQLIQGIRDFKKLEILKVAWGVMYIRPEQESMYHLMRKFRKSEPTVQTLSLPKTLKKLELQCFPDAFLPIPLLPNQLLNLEKLYIKGALVLTEFGRLPAEEPTKCNVKVLRLKFLPKLKVEWRELSQLYFPKLSFLEKYKCPQVSFCPTDGIGIWRKP